MPPIAIIAALGVGAYATWRIVRAVMAVTATSPADPASAPVKPAAEGATARDLGSLAFDPKSGAYIPKVDG